ncbi:MAG TPA: hypothetical protein VJT09_06770 [Pyrinomonadaceae bacterium]|nr:hypothetical protein [Pyrinomonadaceae bacterium]
MRILVSLLTCLALLLFYAPAGAVVGPQDRVKITNVRTAEPVVRGVENEFTVEVEYNLDSEEEGEINLGFNSQKPGAFKMEDSFIIKKGSGTATLKAKVIPVDWGQRAKFTALVNLSKYPHDFRWNPITRDKQEIVVGQ